MSSSNNKGRLPGDDFYCFKYQVWYRTEDCTFRHHFRTFAGCADCRQGAFNLLRRGGRPVKARWTELLPPARVG
jgi:hypothetical protein